MKYIVQYGLVLMALLLAGAGMAQKGTIRGSVIDDNTGETIVGATVTIKGTGTGTATDLDGKFSLALAPGSYNLQVSFISYNKLTVADVKVKGGEVTVLNNLRLKEAQNELQEVVVTAEAVRNTEAALMTLKQKSARIMDGISASKIRLTGDDNAAEAVKRVTGVSVEGGKYVYIRGLGDRYIKNTLNQMDIPGLDPDKNTLQMDIFPTNLIDNITVDKTFTADKPADFTGGLLDIEIKDFPEKEQLSLSAGAGFNPAMHFNSDYLTYEGGDTDFLGFDDGTRALPDEAGQQRIPTPISGASHAQVNDFIKGFNPNLSAERQQSFMDYSLSASYGNQIALNKAGGNTEKSPKLGYFASVSYKAEHKFYQDVEYGSYNRYQDPGLYDLKVSTRRKGAFGEDSRLIGLLGGMAYKTNQSKIRFTAMHLQSGVSRASKFRVFNNEDAAGQSGYIADVDNLEYNQRALSNFLLHGKHRLGKWELDWRLSPTLSSSQDPDIRKTGFTIEDDLTYFQAGAGGFPSRFWRKLEELTLSGKLDVSRKYTFNDREAKFKVGLKHTYKQRDYEIRLYNMQFFGQQPSWPRADADLVLQDENIYPDGTIYYQSGNSNPNPNAYESNANNSAFYISNKMELLPNFTTIIGLRAENFVQRHTGRDQAYAQGNTAQGKNLDNEKVLEALDLFPAVNLIYGVTANQNLRLSYSRTIARPSFKELSFAQIMDPMTNRIFNGSLFTYKNWDGNLTETRVNNVDLRWELFMEGSQLVSVSGFYKAFDKPIELVRIPEQQTSTEYQPRNVGDGRLYGVEFEFRKNLAFLSPALKPLMINGNITLVESQIDMTEGEYQSRLNYQREGQEVKDTRQMAGQSPYVINGGITYTNNKAGLNAGVFYNVKGKTLSVVGIGLQPNVYIHPYHSLSFSINKSFGKENNATVDLKVSNVLGSAKESYFHSYKADPRIYSSVNPGTSFSLGFGYKF